MTESTPPQIQHVPADVVQAVDRMKRQASNRLASNDRALRVRRGEFSAIDGWSDKFSDAWPKPIVANMIDVFARDMASNLANLPSLACSAGSMKSDADKRRAEKKNRIGADYWRHARLKVQMKYGADQYGTYGFLPFWVEADYKNKKPLIHVIDPIGCFFELNRWLETERFARCWKQSLGELAALYPEYRQQILTTTDQYGRAQVADPSSDTDVVQYVDGSIVAIFLPARDGLILVAYNHKQDFCPVHVGLRPGVESDPRGQFDDVLYVQLAHAVMAALTLEAGHKAVQAPIAVPSDVSEVPIGPDGLIVTDSPDKVARVRLDVPQAAFALGETLSQELQQGSGVPDTRLGVGPAGGSTGRGISALEGGFDSQIKQGQDVLGEALRLVTEMCFKMDAKLWPRVTKTINGTISGESFEMTYTPGRDLAGNTSCDVTYGFASGLSPNSAIVTLLQLRGDQVIGRDTFRRNLPIDIDVDQQQRELDEQTLEDAIMQGLAAGLQSSGQMIVQGQQAAATMFFKAAVEIIRGRRNGKDMADLVDSIFVQPAEQAAQQAAQAPQGGPPGAPGAPGAPGGDALDGVDPNGLPQGVAPGQAALPPGGRPSVQDLSASFTPSGSPSLGAAIRRRVPTG